MMESASAIHGACDRIDRCVRTTRRRKCALSWAAFMRASPSTNRAARDEFRRRRVYTT
jgi:hypothetical protein